MYDSVIFREYDIRGVYNQQFDNNFANLLGQAFVTYLSKTTGNNKPTITIGYDARVSSPQIAQALSLGIRKAGGDVLLIGLVTTPMSYFTTFEIENVNGAVMVTGSHNPPEYNGFKISAGKSTIFGEEIQILKKIIMSGQFTQGSGSETKIEIKSKYLERYEQEFGKLSPVKVVLDCGNGAAGSIVRDLFARVGLNPTILFEDPDGSFPNHHPDPTVEKNLAHLKKKVLEEGAICGIGFDGDADRIGVVDHSGRMIFGDELMTIIARDILTKQTGAKIIGDVKCSDRMYSDISQRGGHAIMWKTGHSLIKEKIKSEKAPFGGEMSGHIFFADRNYGYDDAPYAALRLVEILGRTGKSIPELLSGLPTAFSTPEIRIDTTEEKKILAVQKMIEAFPDNPNADYKVNLTDGIRISFAEGWALCRASNTQPVIVLRYESNSQEGMEQIKQRLEKVLSGNL